MGTKQRTTVNIPNRLGDFRLASASYGKSIPLIYGQARVAANITAFENFTATTEVAESSVSSGGKGGSIDKTRDYTYTFSADVECGIGFMRSIPNRTIGFVWEQDRKMLFRSSPWAEGGKTKCGDYHYLSAHYEMGTKPSLPNLAFEANGDDTNAEWTKLKETTAVVLPGPLDSVGGWHCADSVGQWFAGAYHLGNGLRLVAYREDTIKGAVKVIDETIALSDICSFADMVIIGDTAFTVFQTAAPDNSVTTQLCMSNLATGTVLPTIALPYASFLGFTKADMSRDFRVAADGEYLWILCPWHAGWIWVYRFNDDGLVLIAHTYLFDDAGTYFPTEWYKSAGGVDEVDITQCLINSNGTKLFMAIEKTGSHAGVNLLEWHTTGVGSAKEGIIKDGAGSGHPTLLAFDGDGEELAILCNRINDDGILVMAVGFNANGGESVYYEPDLSAFPDWSVSKGVVRLKDGYISGLVTRAGTPFLEQLYEFQATISGIIVPTHIGSFDPAANHTWAKRFFGFTAPKWRGYWCYYDSYGNSIYTDIISAITLESHPGTVSDLPPVTILTDFITDVGCAVDIDGSALHEYTEELGLRGSVAIIEKTAGTEVVADLLTTANGVIRRDGSTISLLPYMAPQAYHTISEGELLELLAVGFGEKINGVSLEYENRTIDYASDVYEIVPDVEFPLTAETTSQSVKSPQVAAIVSQLLLRKEKNQYKTYSMVLPFNYIDILPGDVVTITGGTSIYITAKTVGESTLTLEGVLFVEGLNIPNSPPVYLSEYEQIGGDIPCGLPVIGAWKGGVGTQAPYLNICFGGGRWWGGGALFVSRDDGWSYRKEGELTGNRFIGEILSLSTTLIILKRLTTELPPESGYLVGAKYVSPLHYSGYEIDSDGAFIFHPLYGSFDVDGLGVGGRMATDEGVQIEYDHYTPLYYKIVGYNVYGGSKQDLGEVKPRRAP